MSKITSRLAVLALATGLFGAPNAGAEDRELCSRIESIVQTESQWTNYHWQAVNCDSPNAFVGAVTACDLSTQYAADQCEMPVSPGQTAVLLKVFPSGGAEPDCEHVRCGATLFEAEGGRGPFYTAYPGIDAQDYQPVPVTMSIKCVCTD